MDSIDTSPSESKGDGIEVITESLPSQDEADMAEQGKKQRFVRNFGLWSMLGFTATSMSALLQSLLNFSADDTKVMCTWEGIFFANAIALGNGGGPTLIYGFVLCFLGALATAASLAEMASFAPTSGGQYHWVSILAPKQHTLQWITGWIATMGWNANVAAGVFFTGTVIQGIAVLDYPDYVPTKWQGTLIMWAALLVCLLVNTVGARLLPKFEYLILFLHTAGFLAVLIPLLTLAPKASAADVFRMFAKSGWSSNGVAFLVGLLGNNLPFIGYDGPCHMAEEVSHASVNVPRCMVGAVLLNGILGIATCIAIAFTTGDLAADLASPTGYDFIPMFFNATKSIAGSSVMTAILAALVICASFGFLATASRQTWAFARDRGLPLSSWIAHVDSRFSLPLRAVGFSTVFGALICLINIGSTAAFNAIISIVLVGLFTSFLIPILLIAIKRIRGEYVRMGPWRLGALGLPVNLFAVGFLFISIVFSFFPGDVPVTLLSMNWSVVVVGGVNLLGFVWYAIEGRTMYHGPVLERPILVHAE